VARRIYVETTIPSFYFEIREAPEMVARREWTRRWWHRSRAIDDLVTSAAVIDELERGQFPSRKDCLELLRPLPIVSIEPPVVPALVTPLELIAEDEDE